MSYLRQGEGCMTNTGKEDKCSKWEKGVTVDKSRIELRER